MHSELAPQLQQAYILKSTTIGSFKDIPSSRVRTNRNNSVRKMHARSHVGQNADINTQTINDNIQKLGGIDENAGMRLMLNDSLTCRTYLPNLLAELYLTGHTPTKLTTDHDKYDGVIFPPSPSGRG
jgi:hypothetical protein